MLKIIAIGFCIMLASSYISGINQDDDELYACINKTIKLDQIVAYDKETGKKLTLKDVLARHKAHCQGDKLCDGNGKNIVIYRVRPVGKRGGLCAGMQAEDFEYSK